MATPTGWQSCWLSVNPGLLQVGLVKLGWPSRAVALVSLTLKDFGVGVAGCEGAMVVLLPLHATSRLVSSRTNKEQGRRSAFKERLLSSGSHCRSLTMIVIRMLYQLLKRRGSEFFWYGICAEFALLLSAGRGPRRNAITHPAPEQSESCCLDDQGSAHRSREGRAETDPFD